MQSTNGNQVIQQLETYLDQNLKRIRNEARVTTWEILNKWATDLQIKFESQKFLDAVFQTVALSPLARKLDAETPNRNLDDSAIHLMILKLVDRSKNLGLSLSKSDLAKLLDILSSSPAVRYTLLSLRNERNRSSAIRTVTSTLRPGKFEHRDFLEDERFAQRVEYSKQLLEYRITSHDELKAWSDRVFDFFEEFAVRRFGASRGERSARKISENSLRAYRAAWRTFFDEEQNANSLNEIFNQALSEGELPISQELQKVFNSRPETHGFISVKSTSKPDTIEVVLNDSDGVEIVRRKWTNPGDTVRIEAGNFLYKLATALSEQPQNFTGTLEIFTCDRGVESHTSKSFLEVSPKEISNFAKLLL